MPIATKPMSIIVGKVLAILAWHRFPIFFLCSAPLTNFKDALTLALEVSGTVSLTLSLLINISQNF